MLCGAGVSDSTTTLVLHEIREIETWIARLLSAPVPVPGKTKVQLEVTKLSLALVVDFMHCITCSEIVLFVTFTV